MSDYEFGGSDDVSLPKATVQKILTEILPPNSGVTTSKEFRDAMAECCVEFVTLIASEANEISERDAKKTIGPEHITAALKELGFPEYIKPIQEAAEEFKQQQASRERRQNKQRSNYTDEELMRMQEELLKQASDRFNSGPTESNAGEGS